MDCTRRIDIPFVCVSHDLKSDAIGNLMNRVTDCDVAIGHLMNYDGESALLLHSQSASG